MVLLEGMAAGCTVVASDIPGYRAAAGGHAVLVPPADPLALGLAVARALGTDRAAREASRQAAVAHAGQWSMARLAARYAEIYRRVTVG